MRRINLVIVAVLVAFGCGTPLDSDAAVRRTRARKVWTPPKVVDLLPRYPGGVLQSELVLEKGYILPAVARFANEALGINLADAARRSETSAEERQRAADLKALGAAIAQVDAVYLNQVAFPNGADAAEVMAYFAKADAAKGMRRVLYLAGDDGRVTSVWAAWGGKDLLGASVIPDKELGKGGRMLYAARIQGSIDLTKLLQIPSVRKLFLRKSTDN